jgi:hypothetical protein
VTAIEEAILRTLIELQQAVQAGATAEARPPLQPFFRRLDELEHQLPADADPTLRHYLQRKSYEKARLWLEGRDAENAAGACRR